MSINEQKRENRLRLVEDHIGRSLAESERNGELRQAASFGKPQDLGDGYEQTPAELRMGLKILKDAGYVPAEVELMREIESLSGSLHGLAEGEERRTRQQHLSALRQKLAMALERLRAP